MVEDQGGWLFAVITILGVVVLAGAMIYGAAMWRTQRRNPAVEAASREATKAMYHHEDAEAEARAEGRPTVDTTARPS
jgi:flagellar basal body-associated protein FliL